MRSLYVIAAVGAIGLAGWVALGQAGPKDTAPPPLPAPPDPIPGERPAPPSRPMPRPKPIDDPFDDVIPAKPKAAPPVRPAPDTVPPIEPEPTRVTPIKPAINRDPTKGEIKPTLFIPFPDGMEGGPRPSPRADVLKPAVNTDEPRPIPKMEGTKSAPGLSAGPPPAVPAAAAAPAGPSAAAQQEPAVRLEWHGPTTLQVGAPADYTLIAKNTSAIPLHKVMIQVKVPAGAKVGSTDPKSDGTAGVLVWDHGALQPGEEKAMKMSFVPPGKGEMLCQAWVTFTGSSALKAQVREPKLAVVAKAPDKVAIGENVNLILTVSNPGDHPAEAVKVTVALGDGLDSPKGPRVMTALDTVLAGESREVKVPCVARTSGAQTCEVTVDGAGGLRATTTLAVAVVQPRLHLEVAGPKLRYLDRKAAYVVKVTNSGDAPAAGVTVSETVPAGFKFVSADGEGKFDPDSRQVNWTVGDVGPGQAREFKFELVATGTGEFTHKVTASGERGVKAEQTIPTKVEGVSALAMEVVDTDDPVEVGSTTTYEVRVANTGSKDETDVRLVCTVPPQMKFKAATGPGKYDVVGTDVVFDTLKRLPARSEVTFKVTVTASAKGDARFKATLTAGGLSEPVIKQESTRVYSD